MADRSAALHAHIDNARQVLRGLWRRLVYGAAVALVTPIAVAIGLGRAVRRAPLAFVAEYPQGPIRASWEELRKPSGPRWVQRVNVYGHLLARAPESLYPLFAVGLAAFTGWVILMLVEDVLTRWARGMGLVLSALIVLYGATAGVGLYQLAMKRTRKVLSAGAARWPLPDRAFACGLAIYVPTIAFAAVATMLVRYDALAIEGAGAADPSLTRQAFATYLWYLADAVPVLKIPETVHWAPALRFPSWQGGFLALLYKLVLILPAAHLLTYALTRLWEAERGDERG